MWHPHGSIIALCKIASCQEFLFSPCAQSCFPWFWTAEAIAPGWSSTEFSPFSMPGKGDAASWHLCGDSSAVLGLAPQLPVIFPSPRCGSWRWTSSRDRAEGNSFQLLEVRASLCFWGPRGGFFACELNAGVSGCCFLTPGRIFSFKYYPVSRSH